MSTSLQAGGAGSKTRRTADSERQQAISSRLLSDRFRLSEEFDLPVQGSLSAHEGYFQLGSDIVCYGQCSSGTPAALASSRPLHDAFSHISNRGGTVQLPFDAVQLVDNLRCERYVPAAAGGGAPANQTVRDLYYFLRPVMPVPVRRHIQALYFKTRMKHPFPAWPVDSTVESIYELLLAATMRAQGISRLPFVWFWPEGAPSCTMITHDVETAKGVRLCSRLMDLNDSFGIKTSFHFIPEQRYPAPKDLMREVRDRGFEINVHDLNHDGHLFRDHGEFLRRARKINRYVREFEASGFRSAIMYRNVDWLDAIDVDYDMSIPNSAHLDPQPGGCCTVFPFFIGKIIELPTTAIQDYSLFHILHEYSTRLWRQQVAAIAGRHGLAAFVIHPDYIFEKNARNAYTELLGHLTELRAEGKTWIALPNEIAGWWRLRSELNVVHGPEGFRIEGQGSSRARLAWAVLDEGKLRYEF